METQGVDFHQRRTDKWPRKRSRLTWEMPPVTPPDHHKMLPTIYPGKELGPVANYAYSSIYYKGVPHNVSPPWGLDDKDGHYAFAICEKLNPRYRILSKMGEGTFGEVLECLDNEKKEVVAIKIVRSTQKYREAAMIEINVLMKLARHNVCGIL
ncbi:unnamed protein product [Fraxinus pennsylvanica]|uniref:Protein kinase domain-containing protein n=1 Tax=Fraxinus pennsylvanica TaxID=56036 RepID=A0AAD2DRP0_9LAMI|nr:unnamed protein product [Fraxinus pennsylvanica]